jgi:hypothetical protein
MVKSLGEVSNISKQDADHMNRDESDIQLGSGFGKLIYHSLI